MPRQRRGNCYAASEALYHILGGKAAGWTPMHIKMTDPGASNTENHWFLRHKSGMILDPSTQQFDHPGWWKRPDYSKARGSGFLTKRPSRRARALMKRLTWQSED